MFVPGNEVDVALPLGGASKHYIASRNGGGFYDPFYHQSDSLVKMAMGVQLVDDQADANMETAYLGGIAYLVLTREVNRGSVLKVCTSVDNAKETAKFMLCFHEQSWYIVQVTNESKESTGVHYGQQWYENIKDEEKKDRLKSFDKATWQNVMQAKGSGHVRDRGVLFKFEVIFHMQWTQEEDDDLVCLFCRASHGSCLPLRHQIRSE